MAFLIAPLGVWIGTALTPRGAAAWRGAMLILLGADLCAFLVYAAFSGGGV